MLFSSLLGEDSLLLNSAYYVLVEYVVGLSCFIAVWILVIMSCQVFGHRSLGIINGESDWIEFLWTVVPTLLVFILSLLNVSCFDPHLSCSGFSGVKVVGHQWYWSYSLPGSGDVFYDSVMGVFIDSVDKPLRLENGSAYCLYVTSADVIHSFSVPFLGVKVDAIPGRVNQFPLLPDFCGSHVGYCSELCGAGHAYMPIVIEVVPSV